jgi:mxaA protein
MKLRALLCLLLTSCWVSPAQAALHWVRIEEARNFGYFVGDLIERRASVLTDRDDQLLAASLPKPGPVNYWLELTRVDVGERSVEDGRLYHITLVYQSFYTPLDPRKLTIPAWPLAVASGGSGTIPQFTFTVSPIRELFPEKSGETKDTFLRADLSPTPIPTGETLMVLAACVVAALMMLMLMARDRAWWPFHRRPTRPFARAARALARMQAHGDGAGRYRDALGVLHRAFDITARHPLLAGDVAAFLSRHPEFAGRNIEIESFFDSSRRAFFGDDEATASALMPLGALRILGENLAKAERTRT